MTTVALIGPDGAGKSTVSRALAHQNLPAAVRTIYMGVNLDESRLLLPTTRLALAVKRARGRHPDMVASTDPSQDAPTSRGLVEDSARSLKRAARLSLWLAEEWFRQAVAARYARQGAIVVFDRHFFADYYHYDVATTGGRRPLSARIHGVLLKHVYPKPDLVICLDAPGEVLYRRKQEASPEWLEQRRHQYLELAAIVPHFAVVDATRPTDDVAREVAEIIAKFYTRGKL
jgi:thymidylate kinase